MKRDVVVIGGDGLAKQLFGHADLAFLNRDHAQEMQRIGMGRMGEKNFPAQRSRLVDSVFLMQFQGLFGLEAGRGHGHSLKEIPASTPPFRLS